MEKNIKFLTGLGLSILSMAGVFVVCNPSNFNNVQAEFVDNGVHYTGVAPTFESAGTKEYWVSCLTHTTYFEQPSNGTWVEGGEAQIFSQNDERYIPQLDEIVTEEDKQAAQEVIADNYGVILDDTFKTVVDVVEGAQDVIIPEGVTGIDYHLNPFNSNSDVKSIEVPTTFDSFSWHDVINCDHLKEITIRAKEIKYDSIVTCKNLQTVNIGKEVKIVCYGAFVNVVPVNSKLTINCEVSERPSGWDMNWNIKPNYSSYFTTNWGATF